MEDRTAMDEPRLMKDVIYENRKKKQLTQEELAELLNVSNKTVSKWERGLGYPDITIVPLLAKVLDISLNELFDAEDTTPKNDEIEMEEDYNDEVYSVEVVTKYRLEIKVSIIILVIAIITVVTLMLHYDETLFNIGFVLGIILILTSVMYALVSSINMYCFLCNKLHKNRYIKVFKNNLITYSFILYTIALIITTIILYYEKALILISSILYLIFAIVPVLVLLKLKLCLLNKINILLWIISFIIFVTSLLCMIHINVLPYISFFVFSQIINYTIIFLSNDIKK